MKTKNATGKERKSYWKENQIGTHIMNLIRNKGFKTYNVIKNLEAVCGKSFYNYMNNITEPPMSFIIELSKLLNIPMEELLKYPENICNFDSKKHKIFNETISRHTINTEQALLFHEKVMKWEEDLQYGGEKWSLFSGFPYILHSPSSVVYKTERYVNKKYLNNKGNELPFDVFEKTKRKRKESEKKFFCRLIFTLKSFKNFLTNKGEENLDITSEEKFYVIDEIIKDINEGKKTNMIEIGFLNDTKENIKVGFSILNTIAVIESIELHYNVTNDPTILSNLRRKHEKYWNSDNCITDPDSVLSFLDSQKDLISKFEKKII